MAQQENKIEKIVLIGAGGHCHSCIDVIEQEGRFEIAGILDDALDKQGISILGYPVIGTGDALEEMAKKYDNFLITIGQIKSNMNRLSYYSKLKSLGVHLPVIKSPYSYISNHSVIGEGTIVMHGAMVNANTEIGPNCIINTNALIEHDCRIGGHCHISTSAVVNGTVAIAEHCFIGSNATLVNNIELTENTLIGAGSVVLRSITQSGVYVGNPVD